MITEQLTITFKKVKLSHQLVNLLRTNNMEFYVPNRRDENPEQVVFFFKTTDHYQNQKNKLYRLLEHNKVIASNIKNINLDILTAL